MTVLPFVLAAMSHLSPHIDHAVLAQAIAKAVDESPPIFPDDADRRRTAALAVAVAFRESSFNPHAVGDNGASFCAFQIHVTSKGSRALLANPDHCAQAGLALLRASYNHCPSHPVATFAAGPSACTIPLAQRISRDRVRLGEELLASVKAPATAGRPRA
jgi:hypothetical protein